MRLIDADALKEFIGTYDGTTAQVEAVEVKYIDNAPTIDTSCPNCDSGYAQGYSDGYLKGKEERPQGEWIDTGEMEEYWAEEYQCSICGTRNHWHRFCPCCGAEMRGEENDV